MFLLFNCSSSLKKGLFFLGKKIPNKYITILQINIIVPIIEKMPSMLNLKEFMIFSIIGKLVEFVIFVK